MSFSDQPEFPKQGSRVCFLRQVRRTGPIALGHRVVEEPFWVGFLEAPKIGGGLVGGYSEPPHQVIAVDRSVPKETPRRECDALLDAPAQAGGGMPFRFVWP